MKFAGILKNRTVKNAGWIIGGRLTNKVIAFLVGLLTARYLGPGNYGLVTYATAYTTFFASLCTLGINSVIIKNFVDHPDEQGEAIGTALVLRAVSSFLSAVVIIGIVSIIDRGEPLTILVVALTCVELLFQVFDTFKQWFQSRLESKYAALASFLSTVVVSAYKIFLLATGKSVIWFALSLSVDYAVVAVCLALIYRRKNGPRLSFSWGKGKQLLLASYSFIISGLMVSVYSGTDKLMLKQMLSEESVGYYALAVSLSTAGTFVLDAIIQSVTPSIIQAAGKDRKVYEKRNRQLYALVFYIALVFSAVICLFAEPVVRWFYGERYAGMVSPLRIVVWYTAFSYLGVARNPWLVCENKQKYQNVLYFSAAILNVIMNAVLIPLFGASGAAAASLMTQISTSILLPAVIKPLRPNARLMLEAFALKDIF